MKNLLRLDPLFNRIGGFYTGHPYRQILSFGVVLMSIPFLHGVGLITSGTLGVWAYITIMTVVALGLNLLLGFSGLISLGTAGFMGAGALGLGVFSQAGVPFEIAVILVLFISTLVGLFIGFFSLKVEGIYLAIATLFIGEILRQIYTTVPIFGGQSIRIGSIRLLGFYQLSTFVPADRRVLFALNVLLLIGIMLIMYNLIHSKTGRGLMAISRSSSAAQAMGVSLLKYRMFAFGTATFLATFGGIRYGLYYQFSTTTEWTLNLSLLIIAMVVVGGYKSLIGTFLGASIIHGIPNLFLKNLFGDISYAFSGLLIILVILFYQNGAAYFFTDLRWRYLKLKKRVMGDE